MQEVRPDLTWKFSGLVQVRVKSKVEIQAQVKLRSFETFGVKIADYLNPTWSDKLLVEVKFESENLGSVQILIEPLQDQGRFRLNQKSKIEAYTRSDYFTKKSGSTLYLTHSEHYFISSRDFCVNIPNFNSSPYFLGLIQNVSSLTIGR